MMDCDGPGPMLVRRSVADQACVNARPARNPAKKSAYCASVCLVLTASSSSSMHPSPDEAAAAAGLKLMPTPNDVAPSLF